MIKVAVYGAQTPTAGELIRILVNHPEVDSIEAVTPSRPMSSPSALHHGLVGEANVRVTDHLNPSHADIIFVCHSPASSELENFLSQHPDTRVVSFDPADRLKPGYIFGLSEIFRKELVRGATRAVVPHPLESMALIALFPLASLLLLNSDIEAHWSGHDRALADISRVAADAAHVREVISGIQRSFNAAVTFSPISLLPRRGLKMEITIPCALPADELRKAVDERYDDHNFTFTTAAPAGWLEVEGTHKCILSFSNPQTGILRINAVADAAMRGGAGEAVHLMNLLFGLHEKTGLALKASGF